MGRPAVLLALFFTAVPCVFAITGITYAPYTAASTYCLTPEQVEADAWRLFSVTKRVRTYALACPNSTDVLLSIAKKTGGQVMVGVRLYDAKDKLDKEFSKLATLLGAWGRSGAIYSIGVGNEWFTSGGSLYTLLTSLDRARAMAQQYGISVTTAELPEIWTGAWSNIQQATVNISTSPSGPGSYFYNCTKLWKLPTASCALLARVHWVGVQVHPYFKSLPVSCSGINWPTCYNASTWVINMTRSVNSITRKFARVTEVGWPSRGERCCQKNAPGFPMNMTLLAVPSLPNAASFLSSLSKQARAAGITVFHFQAFDPDWKRVYMPCKCTTSLQAKLSSCVSECEYEYNWGIWYSNRTLKPGMKLGPATW